MTDMDGYEFCKKILTHPAGGVEKLLELAGGSECEWLELKASVELTKEDQEKGDKPEDLYWSIANAIIGLMNACGGCVIIGIDNEKHERVPLEQHDPHHYLAHNDIEGYLRREIYDKVWDSNKTGKKTWGIKKQFHSKCPLPVVVETKAYPYMDGPVAVIFVRPYPPCLRVWEGEIEQIRYRVSGSIGKTQVITGADAIIRYEKEEREGKKKATADQLFILYGQFAKPQKKWKKLLFLMSVIACFFALLYFPFLCHMNFLVCIFLDAIVLSLFAFFVLPVLCAPDPVQPVIGRKSPDQFIVEHPLPTLEWCCLNHRNWWTVSETVKTYYGQWELQRNKISGMFRIIDPRNIMRCWGTQKQVIPVFNQLRGELEKECPPTPPAHSK